MAAQHSYPLRHPISNVDTQPGAAHPPGEETDTNPVVKRLVASLRENEIRFSLLADHFPGIISIYDPLLRFKFVNQYGAQVAGRTLHEMRGRSDEELFPPEVCACYMPQLRLALMTGQPQSFQVTFPDALNHATALITYIPMLNAAGQVEQILTIAQDVTERSLIEEELGRHSQRLEQLVEERTRQLQESNAQLQREIEERKKAEAALLEALEREHEINMLKSRLASMISHEYRTPLTAIMNASEMLLNYADRLTDDRRQHYLLRIQSNVRDMNEMINDMLNLGRLEAGKENFYPEQMDIESFANEVCQTIRQLHFPDSPLHFFAAGLPANIMADPRLIRTILSNLVYNAFKFSPEKTPVMVTLTREQAFLKLTITDHGIGIPADDQKRMFETFARASNASRIQGSGLGLAITKLSVELHGGQIRFTSTEGLGTTFTVTLPLVLPEQPVIAGQ